MAKHPMTPGYRDLFHGFFSKTSIMELGLLFTHPSNTDASMTAVTNQGKRVRLYNAADLVNQLERKKQQARGKHTKPASRQT